ncbi:MAG: cell division protein FtsW [Alphaproteobacteria bacterium]|jgi:cell division protein FtsW|nr:cell division protein FtsW [Alphaproteobacteria bacterium]MBN9579620.1 cell division protein FtsW [Alphaproteobacteria bacterium]
MALSRADRRGFADWWWTIDRVAFIAMLALIAIGLVLAFAASPAATGGPVTAGDFRYAGKQIAFALIAAGILGSSSVLSMRAIKLTAAIVFALAVIGCGLTLLTGDVVLGAKRWIDLGWFTFQPSEFVKPSFAVLGAAILADRQPMAVRKEFITLGLVALPVVFLLFQPDVGQTGLLIALWGALLFFAGLPLYWMGIMTGGGAGLFIFAYTLFPHVQHRVSQYLAQMEDPEQAGYQVGLALKAFEHGGFLGVGPGSGTIKYRLPDAHSDFIFAVAGEEFGFVLCAAITALFCVLTVRLLLRSARMRDPFAQLAGAGLAIVIALQAFINMGVAISLLPAKGMTLPFISYGGSSLFAVALTMGFALAVTRQRPQLAMREPQPSTFAMEARAI